MSMDWQNLLKQGGVTAAQMAILNQAKQDAGAIPGQARQGVEDIAGMAQPYTTFKPFTVTTASGNTSTAGPGGLTMGLGSQQQQMVDSLNQQAYQQAGMIGQVTPEYLMSQMQALRAPQQHRAQMDLEERLAAQGRLGVQTAAYGGTPEQLAMQKAMQEQYSADSLASLQGARNLQQQDMSNVAGMLNLATLPEQQLLQMMTPTIQAQQIGAGLNQTQANLIGQVGQQYISEIPRAAMTQSGLSQAQAQMLMGMLGSPTKGSGGVSSSIGGVPSSIGADLFKFGSESLGSLFGNFFGATASQFDNYGSGGFGDAAVEADYEDFLSRLDEGGGVNTPATVTGGGI
jgi:hypothetical protein